VIIMSESIIKNRYNAPNGLRVGHVHLKVSDLDLSLSFYRDLLGFKVTQRYGTEAIFLAAGDYHHHVGLNIWYSKGNPPAPAHAPGLFHTAFLYPERKDLAEICTRLLEHGYPLTGAADHGVSEALYLDDPDGNGVELYWDKPMSEWPRKLDGSLDMYTRSLDLKSLMGTLA
jgi:catechol 2,3-dioxygenase